jgi:hypothetical protein
MVSAGFVFTALLTLYTRIRGRLKSTMRDWVGNIRTKKLS